MWDFGDGETGAIQSPEHLYTGVDNFDIVFTATNGDGSGMATGIVQTYEEVSHTEAPAVSLSSPSIKFCGAFTCLGWVRNPVYGSAGSSIIPLAVSDPSGDVRDSDEAIYFELEWDNTEGDHRLAFKGSQSKPVRGRTGSSLDDGEWHMLCWVCDDTGTITQYVDGIECPPEAGVASDGVLLSKPHSFATRSGGGYVWVPYLDEAGQAIALFNWRYASGLVLHGDWVRELMAVDAAALGV